MPVSFSRIFEHYIGRHFCFNKNYAYFVSFINLSHMIHAKEDIPEYVLGGKLRITEHCVTRIHR